VGESNAYDMPPGDYIEVVVTDTGVGMASDVKERVFEPFYTTKAPGEGTGLGLAGVYGCVRNHDGAIRVDSAPGQGSAFRMLFAVSAGSVTVETAPARLPIRGQGHILVVDDEETVRRFKTGALERLGYNVSSCIDGMEAVKFLREHHANVDLVILDLIMPKLSGEETFEQLRSIDPSLRVLIVSGFTRRGSIDQMIKDGALGFIHKPFRVDQLSRSVARCLAIET